ncbi:inositol monophosphatase [Chaetomium strumarium]|uniref:Inositol-1-monophosphatase n=1 Tax=Chaetomium strumarium TaxID=1170767 RepID=A0AAJ0GSQ1_9PEZI|nr:inositol monophosphatase [Chaetomium strumarium]
MIKMTTKPISKPKLDEVYGFAIQLGKDAGKLLLDAAQARIGGNDSSGQDFCEKDSAVDIVTKTDEAVETFIRRRITQTHPTHAFVGEESYSKGSSRAYLIDDATPTWCVDPLDGTVNYTHLFPMFCVSIAFVVGGKPVIGVICGPFLNQLSTACRGRGAWLNETLPLPLARNPIPPMPPNAPSRCIFSCEWGKDRKDTPGGNLHRKVDSFLNMAAEIGGRGGKGSMVHGVRSLGSATMDLAYTAMGAFDIWEGGCWEWDVAAGIAILQEAGGLITTANPPEDPPSARIEDAKLGSRLYLAVW